MIFHRMEDYIKILSKTSYYMIAKDGFAYPMRPFIYDVNFKTSEETTKATTWIYFPVVANFLCEGSIVLSCVHGKETSSVRPGRYK
ncbi:hypothetical protein H5410_021760 [Solanum commersonii]|uniref:Uncharacterized protein n=1 Tax=Solanum commersonii TaxID=4109 RepID=A0A9J5ZEV2_SOLCO|nr:hypothetical protein H5410_021760 [Solanum commersonii]